MECSKSSMTFSILLVILAILAVTSAQITFSRQWVRGKYPGDSEGGESPEFQRAAKAIYPSRDGSMKRVIRQFLQSGPRLLKPDYIPILVNTHVLEEILERMREPSYPVMSMENARK